MCLSDNNKHIIGEARWRAGGRGRSVMKMQSSVPNIPTHSLLVANNAVTMNVFLFLFWKRGTTVRAHVCVLSVPVT